MPKYAVLVNDAPVRVITSKGKPETTSDEVALCKGDVNKMSPEEQLELYNKLNPEAQLESPMGKIKMVNAIWRRLTTEDTPAMNDPIKLNMPEGESEEVSLQQAEAEEKATESKEKKPRKPRTQIGDKKVTAGDWIGRKEGTERHKAWSIIKANSGKTAKEVGEAIAKPAGKNLGWGLNMIRWAVRNNCATLS